MAEKLPVQVTRKARGAYFTPPAVTSFMAKWAIRSPDDSVLEPSCGEAEFLLSAVNELQSISSNGLVLGSLHGVELHKETCEVAATRLRERGVYPEICNTDFFLYESPKKFDVVLGNPPYVRYQGFGGLPRKRALEAALREGVRLSGLSSSWAPFVVHACAFLKESGRLGLVLPAELLTVNYASDVRQYLLNRFSRIRLILFEALVFPEVQEEVLLLLAEGQGPTDHFELYEAANTSDLEKLEGKTWTTFRPDLEGKWSPALLPPQHLEAFQGLANSHLFESLASWGVPYLGIVTGNNRFFALDRERTAELGLSRADLVRISPPGSRHLRGLSFSDSAWLDMWREGNSVFLFYPRKGRLTKATSAYIEAGEKTGVQGAYKCRVREPWWRVPLVPIPDLFLTYMDRDQPRLITNSARAAHLNSLYGIRLAPGRKIIGRDLLPLAFMNSFSLLGAEIAGRAYGGGILKLEPREADRIPMPSLQLLKQCSDRLRALRPQLAKHLRSGDYEKAIRLVDRALLLKGAGLDSVKLQGLREARNMLRLRRINRGKTSG